MPFFAQTDIPVDHPEISGLLVVAFLLYVLLSFIRISVHTFAQLRAGRLLSSGNAPPPFILPGVTGWVFIITVLGLIFAQSFFYVFLVLVGIGALLIENGRTADEQFGFSRMPLGRVFRWSVLGAGAVMFIEAPLSRMTIWAMDAIHLPHPEQNTVEMFRRYDHPWQIAAFMLQAVLIFPMIEELFFRGFLLTFLKNHTSTWLAIVLSAGVFAFAHLNLGAVIPLWFLGVALGVAYQHTGTLLLPFGIHACFNLATALSLLVQKSDGS